MTALLALLLAACGGAPAPTPEAQPASSPAPTAGASAAPPAAPTVWNVTTIAQLSPVVPTRQSAVARPVPAIPAYDVTLQVLGKVVETDAGDPDNPWAIAHGMLARGTAFRLSNGKEAMPHLFAAWSEKRSAGGQDFVGFPKQRGSVRIEPHTDLILKNATEGGFAPDTAYDGPAGSRTLADLYRWTVLKTYLVPQSNHSSFDGPNDLPWGLQALAAWAPAPTEGGTPELQWQALDGTPMDLDFLTSFTVAVLTQESAFMFEAMQKKQDFQRVGQPLFSYTCGGSHLVQGASYAVARGFGSAKDRKAVEAQVPLLFYRLPIELSIYDDALKRNPKHRTRLLVQRMKFLGHWLETVSKMQATGIFTPDDQQLRLIEGAAQNLSLAVDALAKTATFDQLPKIRQQDEQLYLDIVGDASHAVRGLELALGRGTIGW